MVTEKLKIENTQIENNLRDLETNINNDDFKNLSVEARRLIQDQRNAMRDYLKILQIRIDLSC